MVVLNFVAESIDKNSEGKLFQSVAVLGQRHKMSAAE